MVGVVGEYTGSPVKVWQCNTAYVKPEDITIGKLREYLSHDEWIDSNGKRLHIDDDQMIQISAMGADRQGLVTLTIGTLIFDDTPSAGDD